MKFRTDFVTNSSDSSFLTFNIKNKRLFDFLTNLGIKIEKTEDGELSDRMILTLPTGESSQIDGSEDWWLPFPNAYTSLSAWVLGLLLGKIPRLADDDEYDDDEDEEEWIDEDVVFCRKLIELFMQADILHLDWEMVQEWSACDVIADFEKAVGDMDGDITDAEVVRAYGMEGTVEHLEYVEVHNGSRMSVLCDDNMLYYGQEEEKESCEGLKFVVTGKLKHFENREAMVECIEKLGGTVSDSVSKNTDFLICNDPDSTSSKMKKAKTLCVPVLTEEGFIRRFADPDEFDLEEDLEEEVEWFETTYYGGVYRMFRKTGIGTVSRKVWKKGKWVNK